MSVTRKLPCFAEDAGAGDPGNPDAGSHGVCITRQGTSWHAPVRALWDDVLDRVFELLSLSAGVLELARKSDRRYGDANLGLVDAVCLALREQHHITTVFTYDRGDFGLDRPTFAASLTLVP